MAIAVQQMLVRGGVWRRPGRRGRIPVRRGAYESTDSAANPDVYQGAREGSELRRFLKRCYQNETPTDYTSTCLRLTPL